MRVQLSWEDPIAGEQQEVVCTVPIALGRHPEKQLSDRQNQTFSQIKLSSQQVSRLHTIITYSGGQLLLEDHSANGTFVNGHKVLQASCAISNGDTLQIGPYLIHLIVLSRSPSNIEVTNQPTIIDTSTIVEQRNSSESSLFNEGSFVLKPSYAERIQALSLPRSFSAHQVPLEELRARVYLSNYEERDFVVIGGGIGSFTFVNTLRIAGVNLDRISVIGRGEPQPYGRYQLICRNSQIPDYERLRSGSDSCPDNIWGFPGYAIREAWRECFTKGRLDHSLKLLWMVFSEPALSDTYTPRSGDVFAAMEREAKRIGWYEIWRSGHVRAIRKTTDDRYVVAYLDPNSRTESPTYKYLVARYVYLSTGYTNVRFLDDLQEYRHRTGDTTAIVNAYENHEHIYDKLMKRGGIVILRGEGIVASRILQRLYEARKYHPQIRVIHLVRSEKTESNRFHLARRYRENGWEFQPFNWPKGTWGGDMRSRLESAGPAERTQLLRDWGGTTTANRRDWRRIVREGIQQLWYERVVGIVKQVDRDEIGRLEVCLQRRIAGSEEILKADFIIDATGLTAKPIEDPLLGDLVKFYNLPLNPLNGLHVTNSFELEKMRNGKGRMFAAGIMTLGGPYAPVDTFLGLQYVAQQAVAKLVQTRAKRVHSISGLRSFSQWLKWAMNQRP
ncbi:FHA domain-containing protein [Leptolyngbya sp. AN03gr2]|uniref:FHA domain-containing protein n=1 Tax=unclassified Leptolyngbya TaxID=2650499 RepID=UPI003D318685